MLRPKDLELGLVFLPAFDAATGRARFVGSHNG